VAGSECLSLIWAVAIVFARIVYFHSPAALCLDVSVESIISLLFARGCCLGSIWAFWAGCG